MNIDSIQLQQDLLNYFTTVINPFDVDLMNIEKINTLATEKLIALAIANGFNINLYKLEENERSE